MLPVAHGLLASTVIASFHEGEPDRAYSADLLLGALLGIAPDLDYLVKHVPALGGGHHGFTHSFVFAGAVGILIAACMRRFNWMSILVYSLAMLSHPLLDYIFTESLGIALLWPFSLTRFKLMIPNPIDYNWRNSSVSAAVFALIRISLIEMMIFGCLFGLVHWLRHRRVTREEAVN